MSTWHHSVHPSPRASWCFSSSFGTHETRTQNRYSAVSIHRVDFTFQATIVASIGRAVDLQRDAFGFKWIWPVHVMVIFGIIKIISYTVCEMSLGRFIIFGAMARRRSNEVFALHICSLRFGRYFLGFLHLFGSYFSTWSCIWLWGHTQWDVFLYVHNPRDKIYTYIYIYLY